MPVEAVLAAQLKPDGSRSRLLSRRSRANTDAAGHRHAGPADGRHGPRSAAAASPGEAVASSPRTRALLQLVPEQQRDRGRPALAQSLAIRASGGADDDANALVPCRGLGVAIGLPRACTVRPKRKRGPLARSVGRPQRGQRARGLRWLLLPIGSRLPVTLSRARPDLRTPPVTVVSARDETVRCWPSTMRNPPNIVRRFWVVASRASARRGGGRPPQRGGSRRRGSGSRRSPGRRSASDSWPAA